MKKNNLKSAINFWGSKVLLAIMGASFLMSCDNDNVATNQENTVIKLSAVYDTPTTLRTANEIVINSFILNIEEIELEVDDDNEAEEGPFASDIELDGPFVVDLIEDSSGIEQILAEVNLPEGNYEELEFSINENEDSESEIFGKSFLIAGTINGTPFEFWHNEDIDFEIEFENGMLTLQDASATLINIQFNLNNLFTLVDISAASDGNGDGIIEINPTNEDGNSDLADTMMDAMDDIIDAFEDSFDEDDEDDEDDDN
ncbi:DUF4382 domain-containing protein [Marivirga sp.]|uniref:DUF4382 domain-containing protein n=1 Tax=Marivirga sp. TaxID=2018662 RepID=UPI002D7F884E|nr:DUF4382 domain-containing protein [Marivirga sp.]HET8860610.1 DUF4382 domain-containing protein [Marivirga sp.]